MCPQKRTVCAQLPLGMLTAGELLLEELVSSKKITIKKITLCLAKQKKNLILNKNAIIGPPKNVQIVGRVNTYLLHYTFII